MVVSERTQEQTHLDIYNQNRGYFLSFLKHTDQKPNTVARMEARLKAYFPRIVEAFAAYSPEGQVLTIGSGAGDDYFPLLHRFPNDNIVTTFHEPNLGMAIQFFIKYLASGFRFDNLEIHKQPLTNAFVSTEKNKYALCVGTHCFYYIDDWESSIRGLVDSTRPGGVAAVTLTSREGDLYKFRERFFPAVGNGKPKCAEDLEELLGRMGIDFISEDFESSLIVDDEEEEKNVLSFMLRKHYDQLDDATKAEIDSYLLTEEKGNGKLKLKLRDKVIWIPKAGEFKFQPGERKPIWEQKYLTVGEFHEFFKFHMDKLIKKDWDEVMKSSKYQQWVRDEFRRGYELLLIGDCFCSDPYFKQISFIDDNRLGAPVKFRGPDGREYWGSPTASQMKLLEEEMMGGEGAYEICEEHSSPEERMNQHTFFWVDDYLDMVMLDINRNGALEMGNPMSIKTLYFDCYREFGHHEVFSMDGFSIFNEIVKQNPQISVKHKRVTPRDLETILFHIAQQEGPEKLKQAISELQKMIPQMSVEPGEEEDFTRLLSELAARADRSSPHNPA
ncbi:MAG: hypothetical protein KAT43_01960 [Nanoarchaeota archaeon]|nr:hypothetical protein [Nanoarchaeota archaeon]